MSYAESIERLHLMERSLKNARENDEAQDILSNAGYPEAIIAEGQALYDTAWMLIKAREQAEITHEKSGVSLHELEEQINTTYMLDRKIARQVFEDNAIMLDYLGLKGEFEDTVLGRYEHARKLYDTKLSEDAAAALAKRGLTAERRAERMAKVDELRGRRATTLNTMSKQKGSTDTRDEAIKEALAWLTGFRSVCRTAFRDKPHLLKLFEIKE